MSDAKRVRLRPSANTAIIITTAGDRLVLEVAADAVDDAPARLRTIAATLLRYADRIEGPLYIDDITAEDGR